MFYLAAFCRKPLAVAIFRACAFSPKISKKLLTFRFCYAILIKSANEYGGIPERPKGADCKSVVHDFAGSNPASPTRLIV